MGSRGEAVDQGCNEGVVGGGEVVGGEVFGGDPPELLAGEGGGISCDVLAEEGVQADSCCGVFEFYFGKGFEVGYFDSQFFAEFAGEGLGEGFVGFLLAAGEFPIAGQRAVGTALADQDLALAENDADGDV